MKPVAKIIAALFVALSIGGVTAYLAGGLPILLIFLMAFADRILKTSSFGINLIGLEVIITGMIYGALPAFLFGTFFGPVVKSVQLIYGMPIYERMSFFESFIFDIIKGLTGIAASLLVQFPPVIVFVAAMIFKNLLYAAADRILGYPFRIVYLVNVPVTMLVFLSLQRFFF